MPSKKKSATSKTKKKVAKKQVKQKIKKKISEKTKEIRARKAAEIIEGFQQARKRRKKRIQEIKEIKKGPPKNIFKRDPDHLEAIQRTLKETQQRKVPELEGDLKDLPEWLPKALVHECDYIKRLLLEEKYTIKEITGFVVARQREFPTVPTWGPNVSIVPKEFQYMIDRLNYIIALIKIREKSSIKKAVDAYMGKGPHELLRAIAIKRARKDQSTGPRADAIGKLIHEIVRHAPDISAKIAWDILKNKMGDGIITHFFDEKEKEEESIEWKRRKRGPSEPLYYAAFKQRLSRAKKKNKSR